MKNLTNIKAAAVWNTLAVLGIVVCILSLVVFSAIICRVVEFPHEISKAILEYSACGLMTGLGLFMVCIMIAN